MAFVSSGELPPYMVNEAFADGCLDAMHFHYAINPGYLNCNTNQLQRAQLITSAGSFGRQMIQRVNMYGADALPAYSMLAE